MGTRAAVIAGYLVIAALAAFRVASTARLFSATADEPMHLACGLDWLSGRPYVAQPDNPPLARIAAALPFARAGAGLPASDDNVARGNAVLYSGDYRANLARARAGNLLFLAAAILGTGAWAARRFGRVAGIGAAALFAWLPPVRAHAGLATTDMAGTASLALSLLAFDRWRDLPSFGRGAVLGAAFAAGALSKFSFVPFFAAAVAVAAIGAKIRPGRTKLVSTAVAAVAAAALVWAGYRFRWGTLAGADPRAPVWVAMSVPGPVVRTEAIRAAVHVRVPAPEFFAGAALLAAENTVGHPAYLFGHVRQKGWWYYFPVALFFKSPIPFLVLAVAGAAFSIRKGGRGRETALLPIAMLSTVVFSSIDIGVRHVLPLYVPLAALGGSALAAMARRRDWRIVAAFFLGWMAIGTETAHPDYLAWFNEAAGRHPERILGDSNLDWGQDWLRFAAAIRDERVHDCTVFFSGTVRLQDLAGPGALRSGPADDRRPGWYALPEGLKAMDPTRYAWLDDYAFRRIGRSIRLYHVPR